MVLTGKIALILLRKTMVLSERIVGAGVWVWHIVLCRRRTMIELIRLVVYLGLDLRSLMGWWMLVLHLVPVVGLEARDLSVLISVCMRWSTVDKWWGIESERK